MKKLTLISVLSFFMLACEEKSCKTDYFPDNNSHPYHITGEVVDIVNGKPLSHIKISVEYYTYGCYTYSANLLDSDTTDTDGHFDIFGFAPSGTDLYLKISNFPLIGYQEYARIEGDLHLISSFEPCFGFLVNEDEKFCKIELIPLTYAKIIKPVIPSEWQYDTLDLTIFNVCPFSLDVGYYCCYQEQAFPLKDINTWETAGKPHILCAGNLVRFIYKIRNGMIKKSGEFTAECAYGDTTDIAMPIF